ncbi:hypothetical protein ACLOJK_009688 [Asimina triloba]
MRFHDYRKRETPAVKVDKDDVEDQDEEAESEIMLMAYDEESIWRDLRDLSPALSPIGSPSRKTGIWDGLGQPSGKFDYQVRYDMPEAFNKTLLEDIKPTGWEDENDDDLPWYLEALSKEKPAESEYNSCTTNYQSCIDELSESEEEGPEIEEMKGLQQGSSESPESMPVVNSDQKEKRQHYQPTSKRRKDSTTGAMPTQTALPQPTGIFTFGAPYPLLSAHSYLY